MNEAIRPRREPWVARLARACTRSSSTSCRGGERVGGDAAVGRIQRGANDAVDLGDQRGAGERLAAVEDREVREGADIGVGGAAYDDRAEGCGAGHEGLLPRFIGLTRPSFPA